MITFKATTITPTNGNRTVLPKPRIYHIPASRIDFITECENGTEIFLISGLRLEVRKPVRDILTDIRGDNNV